MNEENNNVIKAIDEVLPQVARAIEWAGESLNAGGRIIYVGAGTSGPPGRARRRGVPAHVRRLL